VGVEAISAPDFPPAGPWDLYVLFLIWLPFVFRTLLLSKPLYKVIKSFAPHTGWAIKQIRDLPIRGFAILVFNETFAFLIPPISVLILRLFANPVGWQTWEEVSILGWFFLFLLVIGWIIADIFRILRVRRMLLAIVKYDIGKLQKIADAGLKTRNFIRRFAKKKTKETSDESDVGKSAERVGKRALKVWGYRAWRARRLSPGTLLASVAVGAAIEGARAGAGKVSDMIDDKMQAKFDEIAQTNSTNLLLLFLRDIVMGVLPIVYLAALKQFI